MLPGDICHRTLRGRSNQKQIHAPNFVILREEAKMHRTRYLRLVMLVIVLGTTVLLGQATEKAATSGEPTRTEDFATAMKKLRDRWVQEFNAGHADKVADLYAPEAVLMRGNGSG